MRRAIVLVSYGIDKFCRAAGIGFLSLMLLLVLFQVLARYIFQAVPVWTEDAARYCMIWGGLFGATVAFRADRDPRLIQPPQTGSKVRIIGYAWVRPVAVVVFLGPVLYHSGRFLDRGLYRLNEGLQIPMAWITVIVPIAVVIIFIHLLARLIGPDTGQSDRKS
ncbi:MAG TPA: TRAP transporter small permease subunit [Desulfobacterales bacterium]|nr:TRAP transporter small permease subunit [Desulfobacterales bacterium]